MSFILRIFFVLAFSVSARSIIASEDKIVLGLWHTWPGGCVGGFDGPKGH
jgi:hypothetical protein